MKGDAGRGGGEREVERKMERPNERGGGKSDSNGIGKREVNSSSSRGEATSSGLQYERKRHCGGAAPTLFYAVTLAF